MAGDESMDDLPEGTTGRRRTLDRPLLPSARAAVGGLLLALAGVGTFVAWQQASGIPDRSYVVAQRTISPGERVAADDLRVTPIDLPDGIAGSAFGDAAAVEGRVALGPIGQDELVQASQLSDARSAEPVVEVSFALARDRAVDGQLRSGDSVDVFVTYPDRTTAVAEHVQVVAANESGNASFAGTGQVTVTLALDAIDRRADLIHALRAGEVTLVRSTLAGPGPDDAAAAGGHGRGSFRPGAASSAGGGT
jgi:Flp pilus assembly protein CpaB